MGVAVGKIGAGWLKRAMILSVVIGPPDVLELVDENALSKSCCRLLFVFVVVVVAVVVDVGVVMIGVDNENRSCNGSSCLVVITLSEFEEADGGKLGSSRPRRSGRGSG